MFRGFRFRVSASRDNNEFYIWDVDRSGIVNPDTGDYSTPWRKIFTREEAETAATDLNDLDIAIRVVNNGPPVVPAVESLVREAAAWRADKMPSE